MYRVSAIYVDGPGKQFDMDYYLTTHARLVKSKLGPLGLKRLEVDSGVGDPPAFLAKADLLFASEEEFEAAMAEVGGDLMADTVNFTDIEPTIQMSKIVL